MRKIKDIKDVFIKYVKYYTELKEETERELKKCPRKGSIIEKQIGRQIYYYLNYRNKDKVVWEYLGKPNPIKLRKSIKKRRRLLKRYRLIKSNLYALNLAKRQGGTSNRKRFKVFARDNFTCQYCGRSVKRHNVVLVVDHIIPKKKGGSDKMSNLITSCYECNCGKYTDILDSDVK